MARDVPVDVDDVPLTPSTAYAVHSHNLYSRMASTSLPFTTFISRFSADGTTRSTPADNTPGDEECEALQKTVPSEPKIPLYKRRWFIIMNIVVALISIVVLFILLYPVTHAIAQRLVNSAVINIDSAILTSPTDNSFNLSVNAWVSHAGIIPATIKFNEAVTITWRNSTGVQVPLGSFFFMPLTVKNKRAYINQTVHVAIDDTAAFSEFTSALITQPNFTWTLATEKVDVRALTFLSAHNINFQKDVHLSGMNNFQDNITLLDLQLPRDAPEGGGIEFIAVTELHNPSPLTMDLGTVSFDLSYNGLYLGTGNGANTKIGVGANNVTLQGTLVPQNGSDSLARVSQLFTEFLNSDRPTVVAKGRSAFQDGGSEVSWLSAGVASLELQVPFSVPEPINPIKRISIGDMALAFSEQNAWAPIVSSRSLQADLELPFGFNISIGELANAFNITSGGSVVGGLSAPPSASVSQIGVLNTTCTRGTVNITLDSTPLDVPDANHLVFSGFTRDVVSNMSLPFQLEGSARTVANTSIGQITLDPIKFNVTSGLSGLQGLRSLVEIGHVDVVGGSTDAIHLNIPVNIYNPSNLELSTGDLTLQLFRGTALLGTTLIQNMTLQRGNNTFSAQGNFTPNGTPEGMQTLNDFVGGTDVEVAVSGYTQSTSIESLIAAFESLNISATLPALNTTLISSSSLTVLETTGHQNNTAHAAVSFVNPFTADLAITHVKSNISFHGIPLGTIDTPIAFSSKGNSTTESPALGLDLNLDHEALLTVVRICAVDAGLSTQQLDTIVQLGGYHYLDDVDTLAEAGRREAKRDDNMFTGFDLPTFVDKAFTKLVADVSLQAGVTIGEYPTTLSFTQHNVSVKTDETLNLLLPIIAQPIAQNIITQAVLGIETVFINDAKEGSFTASLKGSITNTGPFDANITFPTGLDVQWMGSSFINIAMPSLSVAANIGAAFELDVAVTVTDSEHLADFTKALVSQESVNWVISGGNLLITALGVSVPGASLLGKGISLKGMNNLDGGVKVNNFDLPGDDPNGGIRLTLNTTVKNPSQIGVSIPTVAFQAFFQDVNIGTVSASSTFDLLPLSTVSLPLSGRLIPQTSQAGLDAVSSMFNHFVHGQDSNVAVQGAAAGPSGATWLTEGIKALRAQTALPNNGTLDVIKSINLNEVDLQFTNGTAFDPSMSSNDATAAFALPFRFSVDIIAVGENLTAGSEGTDFAQLIIPKGPCTTDVEQHIIHFNFSDVPFTALSGQHSAFEQFLEDSEAGINTTLLLNGTVDADVKTAIGVLSLKDIQLNGQTVIAGLQGLNITPPVITALDVHQGFPDYLLIKVNSSLFNPSNNTLGTGDASFSLVFQNDVIGEADMSNLTIIPGNQTYPIDVHYQPQGSAVATGQVLLENFLQNLTSVTAIKGSNASTSIQSLQPALSKISLSPVDIPGLGKTLIPSTSLTFPTNIAQTGLAQVSFVLDNPFTASINLLEISATATYENLTLGRINVDRSSNPIHADGHANITSPALPFSMNMDPRSIIEFLTTAAQSNHVDLGPLPAMFQIALQSVGTHTSINVTVDLGTPSCVSGHQFDVDGAILSSLKNLDVVLAINSSVKLDDYPTDLSFEQNNVSAITDKTALYLVGAIAPPILQHLVDQATLSFSQANITDISNEGFDLSLKGALTGAGPFDAQIAFPEPVNVNWQGHDIATISLPPVCIAANEGAPDYETKGNLTVTDADGFTQFATFLLHNPEFDWTISTNALRVTALGTIFDGVSLSKNISFKAFNNLTGVTIKNFQLPSDDPAGGIHIEADSLIPSTADIGIDLGTVTFEASFKGTTLGPLSSTGLQLVPQGTTDAHLSGRIIPKSGADDLAAMGGLFTNFLQSQNQTITIRGDSVQPPGSNSSVSWLSTAFKSLSLDVTLPGEKLEVIQSIDISDFELAMTEQSEAFSPAASSNHVLVQFKNPFGFSLQVVQSSVNMTLSTQGTDAAELVLPQTAVNGGVSTGDVAPLVLSFENQPLRSLNNDAFSQFFKTVTTSPSAELRLKGSTDVVARTSIGNVPISGIPIDVTTTMGGLNSFDHGASLSNFTISGGGQDSNGPFVNASLTTTLNNPSNISLQTVDVELPVFYQGVMLGRAVLNPLDIYPGPNVVPAEFHYAPADANDTTAQSFITDFLQSSTELDLTIKGDANSSPFASLVPALEGVEITTGMKGLNFPPFVTKVNAYVNLVSALATSTVSVDFDIANPLDTEIEIVFAQADSGIGGETYVHFEHAFNSFVVPPHSTANSGHIDNVVLTRGALGSTGLLTAKSVDVFTAATVRIGTYTLPWLHLTARNVPITVHT